MTAGRRIRASVDSSTVTGSPMPSVRLLLSASLSAALVSCGESTAPQEPPASLIIVSGNRQVSAVGQPLPSPLVVRVLTASGKAVKGQVVNFRVTAGGGDVFAGVSITDASGYSSELWTLGTAAGDHHRVEARAVDTRTGAPLVYATFEATALPGPVATIDVTPDSVSLGGAGEVAQLTAAAWDQYGNAILGVAFAWSSGDEAVATVNQTGLVTGVGSGTTTVSARSGAGAGDSTWVTLATPLGIVLWYRMDGDATDASARARHGTIYAVSPVADRLGRPNKALAFAGDPSSHIRVPIDAINSVSAGTIAGWVRPTSVQAGVISVKQHNDINTYAALSIGVYASATGNLAVGTPGRVYYHAKNFGGFIESTELLIAGRWYHVAIVFDGSGARLYLDGRLDAQTAGDFGIPNDTDMTDWRWPGCCAIDPTLGGWTAGAWLAGALDDFRVYDRQLNESEIVALAQGP